MRNRQSQAWHNKKGIKMETIETKWKDSTMAFDDAIESGRLSANDVDANYAGYYFYMGPDGKGGDAFKHVATRKYIK